MPRANKEIITAEYTTPRVLGWQPSSDRTALMDEPISVRTKRDTHGGTIFMAKFRPIKGDWLGQVLTSATSQPERAVFNRGIRADWELFKDAHQAMERAASGEVANSKNDQENIRLLSIHAKDPRIEASFNTFGADYVDLWLNALDDNNNALRKAFRPIEIVDGRYFPEQYIREHDDSHLKSNLAGAFFHHDRQFSLAAHYRYVVEGQTRAAIEFKREEFFAFADWLRTTFPNEHRLRSKIIPRIAMYDNTDIIDSLPLTPRDKWSFPLVSQRLGVSEHEGYSWISADAHWPNYRITDKEIVLYEADTRATIDLEPTDDRARPLRIVGRHVSFDDTSNALSPALAWRHTIDPTTGAVSREFLSRDEMVSNFASEFDGEVLDDWLGIVTLVGFLPTVRSHTHEKMHLQDEHASVRKEGGQDISAAQAPVYYNRPNKLRQIARDPDGVLASLEESSAA